MRARASLAVLLVEDDELLRSSLARVLARVFGHVAAVPGHAAAIAALEAFAFDVVVSDFDLGSGGNGGELLEEVHARWPRMRRVMFTANTLVSDDAADVVLDKSASMDKLIAALAPPQLTHDGDEQLAAFARAVVGWFAGELARGARDARAAGAAEAADCLDEAEERVAPIVRAVAGGARVDAALAEQFCAELAAGFRALFAWHAFARR